MNKLERALDELDKELANEGLCLELVICGAFAIHLLGFTRSFFTYDIDTLKKIESTQIQKIIQEIGNKLGLSPYWLNDQASSVAIPEKTILRAKPIGNWSNIKALVINRRDLIKMKASAFSIRRNETNKDWEDLELLKPTKDEIERAIQFVIETNAPPNGAGQKVLTEFQETIDDLHKLY